MATNEIVVLAGDALAELEAMPPELARKVADAFARFAGIAMSGRPVAAGFDPRDAPALHRLWRKLPGPARIALMLAALGVADVGHSAATKAGEDVYERIKQALRSLVVSSESQREPRLAPPLPRLVTPEDAVCKDSDEE